MTNDELMAAIEARKVNLAYVIYGPHERRWEVYGKVSADRRVWQPASSFRDCCERLMMEREP